jgi:hypothetical protein
MLKLPSDIGESEIAAQEAQLVSLGVVGNLFILGGPHADIPNVYRVVPEVAKQWCGRARQIGVNDEPHGRLSSREWIVPFFIH